MGFRKKSVFTPEDAVKDFMRRLNAEKLQHSKDDEKNVVRVKHTGARYKSTTFAFAFNDDGRSVELRILSLAQFTVADLEKAYAICNDLNQRYTWLRFYIDADNELAAAMEAPVSPDGADETCYELFRQTATIIDSVYGEPSLQTYQNRRDFIS